MTLGRAGVSEDDLWLGSSPPVRSAAVFALLFGFAALLGVEASQETAESRQFVESVPWTVWRAITSATLTVFVLFALQGFRILLQPARWGIAPTRRRRNQYLLCATAGATLITAYELRFPFASADLPVQHLGLRTAVVAVAGSVAVIPWLTIVWLAQAECRDLATGVPGRPPTAYIAALQDTSGDGDTEHFRAAVGQLLLLWSLLRLGGLAFIVGVGARVASTGALRGAFVAAYPKRAEEFPPANVLLYGGFFALSLSIIIVPLVISWRARAQELVEHASPLPASGKPTTDWNDERTRLEGLLRLDISVLRNPLTASSIAAPLLVSAIAAFLPLVAG